MKKVNVFNFNVDKANRKIFVDRSFDAPLDLVWEAWTDASILDEWWAPKPWKAETKSMSFKEGGKWLYAMVGPQGEKHWSLREYKKIEPKNRFDTRDSFCDDKGNIDQAMPGSNWENVFIDNDDTTLVKIAIQYDKLEDLEKYIEMGFKEGFTMGLENLDQYLATNKL